MIRTFMAGAHPETSSHTHTHRQLTGFGRGSVKWRTLDDVGSWRHRHTVSTLRTTTQEALFKRSVPHTLDASLSRSLAAPGQLKRDRVLT